MKSKSLFQSTSLVSAMTLLSRGLGFVRDMIMANLFGATAGFDAFLVAFKIPNFMRALFAEGSFSQGFVPVLAQFHASHSEEEARKFIAGTVGWLAGTLLLITVFFEIMTPLIVLVFAPGFLHDPYRYHIAMQMLRITLPYLMLISVTALWAAALNSYGHFGAPSFTPVILNVALIAAAIYLPSFFTLHEEALAWGVLVAGIFQLLFQIPFLIRYQLFRMPRWRFKDKEARRVLSRLVPALFGVSVMQIGLLLDTLFASFLREGSISWLYYADRLTFFSLGIFGVALATVVLPHLSALYARNRSSHFSTTIDWALRLLLIITLPATLGLMIISGPLTVTLFHHGHFSLVDAEMTQQCILAFSIGLPAFMIVKVLVAAFYARHDIRRPVKIALYSTLVNVVANVILMFPLAHVGLALGTSISAVINAGFLYGILVRLGIYKPLPGWMKFLVQLVFANAVMSCLLAWGVPATRVWLTWPWYSQIIHLLLWLSVSIIVYFACLWVSGMRVKDFLQGDPKLAPEKLILQ